MEEEKRDPNKPTVNLNQPTKTDANPTGAPAPAGGVRGVMEQMNRDALAKQAIAARQNPPTAEPSERQARREPGNTLTTPSPLPRAILPVRTSSDEWIFKSSRPTMNFWTQDNKKVSFEHGYLITKDPTIIAHIRTQFLPSGLVSIVEKPVGASRDPEIAKTVAAAEKKE